MNLKRHLKEYFFFTRKERTGIVVIILIIVVVWFAPVLLETFYPGEKNIPADTSWIAAVKQLEKLPEAMEDEYKNENANPYDPSTNRNFNSSKPVLFYFDPNTLSTDGWKKLGLRDKTIQTIKNYLGKGGHFKTPEDLQKIYGLHADELQRLKSFVRIEQANSYDKPITYPSKQNNSHPIQSRTKEIIDINTADTTAFISLPGIGSKLAARIVNFRDRLGGFYSVEQIKETYGLSDSTFEKIRSRIVLNDATVRKLNINTATKDELKLHPYIKWNLANAIVNYRTQHGNFSKPEDLLNIQLITPEIYLKLRHYITVE